MSFRARLLQTFLTLVIITTGAAMLIAQRQNEVMLQSVVNEFFKVELKAFQIGRASCRERVSSPV